VAIIDFKGSGRKDFKAGLALKFTYILIHALDIEVAFLDELATGILVKCAVIVGTFFWCEAHVESAYCKP